MQGNLAGLMAVLKGTPTTYNKDFQVSVQGLQTRPPRIRHRGCTLACPTSDTLNDSVHQHFGSGVRISIG